MSADPLNGRAGQDTAGYIQELLDSAPLLTAEQFARLRVLLTEPAPGPGPDDAGAAS